MLTNKNMQSLLKSTCCMISCNEKNILCHLLDLDILCADLLCQIYFVIVVFCLKEVKDI